LSSDAAGTAEAAAQQLYRYHGYGSAAQVVCAAADV